MTIQIYGLNLDYLQQFNTNLDVDFYVDTKEYHPNNNKKIYIQSEPGNISGCYDYLNENSHLFDLIFCYDPSRLQKHNVYKRTAGHTWIESAFYELIDVNKKKFAISNITGWKTGCLATIYVIFYFKIRRLSSSFRLHFIEAVHI